MYNCFVAVKKSSSVYWWPSGTLRCQLVFCMKKS